MTESRGFKELLKASKDITDIVNLAGITPRRLSTVPLAEILEVDECKEAEASDTEENTGSAPPATVKESGKEQVCIKVQFIERVDEEAEDEDFDFFNLKENQKEKVMPPPRTHFRIIIHYDFFIKK